MSIPVATPLRLNIAVKDRPRVKLECLRLLATLRLNPGRLQLISGFIDAYLRLNAQEELRFESQVAKLPNRRESKKVMEIVTSWMEKGMQQGMQQGMLRKAREDVIEILEARFATVPYAVRERIQAIADEAELKRLHRQAALVESLNAFQAKR